MLSCKEFLGWLNEYLDETADAQVRAEVEHHRREQRLVQKRHRARAVVADRGQGEARVRQQRDAAAPAEADRPDGDATGAQLIGSRTHEIDGPVHA